MRRLLMVLAVAMVAVFALAGSASAAPLSGAVFTTESTCTGANVNIYDAKEDVFLDGGPQSTGNPNNPPAGLPDGQYYIRVLAPGPDGGTLLGTSIGSGDDAPIEVVGGEFAECYRLSDILIKATDGSSGYDDTTNAGGEYKVEVSTSPTFENSVTKSDNFKVEATNGGGGGNEAQLHVRKYYDANVDGVKGAAEVYLNGWRFNIKDGIDYDRVTPVDITLFAPDTYSVTEQKPVESNWINTDPSDPDAFIDPLGLPSESVDLAVNDDRTLEFGNVCLGAGGGHTLGFWSNKNGQATMNDGGTLAPELALLSSKSLRNANGLNFDPANYTAFRSWLLSANAVNMSNMLSAQYAAMLLNVEAGNVNPSALVWNGSAFVSIQSVLDATEAALVADGLTPDGDPNRASQEALKNTLDSANNDLNFVQANPCAYTFGPLS
jgi:hypothetical protein